MYNCGYWIWYPLWIEPKNDQTPSTLESLSFCWRAVAEHHELTAQFLKHFWHSFGKRKCLNSGLFCSAEGRGYWSHMSTTRYGPEQSGNASVHIKDWQVDEKYYRIIIYNYHVWHHNVYLDGIASAEHCRASTFHVHIPLIARTQGFSISTSTVVETSSFSSRTLPSW